MLEKNYKVITFDLDDTLWECLPIIKSAEIKLRDWLEKFYPKITEKYTLDEFIKSRKNIVEKSPEHAFDFTYIRKKQLYDIAIDTGYQHNTAILIQDQGFEVFITERSNVLLYDDVIPSFNILKKHFRLGALTNGNVDLTKTDLHSYFNFSLNAITAGYAKPDCRFFESACKLANVTANEIIHIGDHPEQDVQGAIAAGIDSIWINRNKTQWPDIPQPNNIIYSLAELPELLLERS